MNPKLLVLCGPTATGKTKLAVSLARVYGAELVSADSRQVYKGMDIATGKDVSLTGTTALWMVDVVYPDEPFSVSHYVSQARSIIADIHKRGKLPIVVGGTGFYIQALISPFETIDIPPNDALRDELQDLPVDALRRKLAALDPGAWEQMNESDRTNPRRLIRKIEIRTAGKTAQNTYKQSGYDTLILGLTAPNDYLFPIIDKRVDKRVEEGVIDEIERLLHSGYSWDLPSMSGLGYRQWYGYFMSDAKEKASLVPAIVQQWKYDEHKYARAQMTWFKKMRGICWFDVSDPSYETEVTRRVSAWYTSH